MMPSPNSTSSSTKPGSAFSGPNAGKHSSRGRGRRQGRGSNSGMKPLSFCTVPNESPQSSNGVKSLNRRRSPCLKNSSTQASKHISEDKSCYDRSESPPSTKTDDVLPSHSNTNDVPKVSNFSSDVKSNIDALVERVRASAMANNRPNTPGSHIDWAGDDDNSLPDLDDWGISPSTLPAGHTMISPIIVDGLTPLPEPATTLENQDESLAKASTTNPSFTSHSPVDNIAAEGTEKGLDQLKLSDTAENSKIAQACSEPESLVCISSAPTSSHPSFPPKPISPARKSKKYGDGKYSNAKKKYPRIRDSRANNEMKASTTPQSHSQPVQGNDLKYKDSSESEKGLAASIHAPERRTASKLCEPKSEKSTNLERHSPSKSTIPTKNLQLSTDGQLSSAHRPTNRPPFSSRKPTTNQTRTQASVANQTNRSSHRPVLSGDAISKIAKTIGAPAIRNSPLSTSTE